MAGCTIYLVRHGQSQANVDGRFGTDEPLTDYGRTQAKELAETLAGIHFDAIYSSPRKRALETATIIAGPRNTQIIQEERLAEKHWGPLEGKVKNEARVEYKDAFAAQQSLGVEERRDFRPLPGIESEQEMMDRYMAAIKDISLRHAGQTVLAVSHQTIMRTLLWHIGYVKYGDLPEGSILNGGYIMLQAEGDAVEVLELHEVRRTDSWF
jgi:broad specificity phosphatase PhoE